MDMGVSSLSEELGTDHAVKEDSCRGTAEDMAGASQGSRWRWFLKDSWDFGLLAQIMEAKCNCCSLDTVQFLSV